MNDYSDLLLFFEIYFAGLGGGGVVGGGYSCLSGLRVNGLKCFFFFGGCWGFKFSGL